MTEPTTLTNAVLPGAGYVHLAGPVPTPCRITLSPDTTHAEVVPVYKCVDDAPYMALLGYGDPYSDRVVLARAHAAGSPVRVEVDDAPEPEDSRPGLPPYSGRAGACPKCRDRHAATKWLLRPTHIPVSDWRAFKDLDAWYHGYLTAGKYAEVVRARPVKVEPAEWWPDEWLGRYCPNCEHRWDEALADVAQAGGDA